MNPEQRELLRRLTLNDESALKRVVTGDHGDFAARLDERTESLVRVAAVVAVGAETASLHAAMDRAHAAGVSDEEILEAVLAIASIIGSARLSTSIPRLLLALERD